ncbi:transposase domain-containing protein [Roseivirga sp. BDSF3-8]
MYNLFGTCKLNDINPLEWLTETLRKPPDYKVNRMNYYLLNIRIKYNTP